MADRALAGAMRHVLDWRRARVAGVSNEGVYLAALDEAFDGACEADTELRSGMLSRFHHIIRTLGGCSNSFASRSSQRTKGRVGRGFTSSRPIS